MVIEVPAEAQLYVDDYLMKTKSDRRVFNTPPLEEGQAYYYDLRAEVTRDGKKQTETKRVIVHAGDIVRASFPKLEDAAAARAAVAVQP
jgi:uncharacterized protein (TIGR03000 family)